MENLEQLRLIGEKVANMVSGPRGIKLKPQKVGGIFVNIELAEKISGLDTIGAPLPDRHIKKDYVPSASDVIFRMYYFRQTEIS